jgi:phage tail protein X
MAKIYKTIAGDTFDIAAYKMLGDESYTDKIMALNPAHIDTVVFPAGVELIIPEKTLKSAPSLPPWKRKGTSS